MTYDLEDIHLLTALQNGDEVAFERIYKRMADKLLRYINSRIHDKELSEEMVQEIFVSLWTRRRELGSDIVLEPYLYSAAKYQVLSHIRSESVRHKYAKHFTLFVAQRYENSTEHLMDVADLKATIEEHIAQLPPKCQQAFRLSRYAHKSITEIAQEMDISTRTVENYITQALKHLRLMLARYPWMIAVITLCRM